MRTAGLVLALMVSTAAADPIIGTGARVIDGDTLDVGPVRIRLCGIDAPERNEPGYQAAADALRRIIGGREVQCVPVGEGTVCDGRSAPTNHGRVVAQCSAGGVDVAAEMVRQGHACDWVKFSGGAYGGRRC